MAAVCGSQPQAAQDGAGGSAMSKLRAAGLKVGSMASTTSAVAEAAANTKAAANPLQDEFDRIKALTMHNMAETVMGGKKLLFLTGEQAVHSTSRLVIACQTPLSPLWESHAHARTRHTPPGCGPPGSDMRTHALGARPLAAAHLGVPAAHTCASSGRAPHESARLRGAWWAQDLLAENPTSLDKMLGVFDVASPQLVINLLESGGFAEWTRQCSQQVWDVRQAQWAPGVFRARAPFTSSTDEREAERRIDMFMTEVLIPLAAQTSAVVLCSAIPTQCILSASFLRMCAAARARWAGKPPFTVLSTTCNMEALYCSNLNTESRWKDKWWRKVANASKAWQKRDAEILAAIHANPEYAKSGPPELNFDLDRNAVVYLIVDESKGVRPARACGP